MFFTLIFAFCFLGSAYGVWSIVRDLGRGHVQGRGFGFDRATQPTAFFALITFNCVVVAVLLVADVFLGMGFLHRLAAR